MKVLEKDTVTRQGVNSANQVAVSLKVNLYFAEQNPDEMLTQPATVDIADYEDKEAVANQKGRLETFTYTIPTSTIPNLSQRTTTLPDISQQTSTIPDIIQLTYIITDLSELIPAIPDVSQLTTDPALVRELLDLIFSDPASPANGATVDDTNKA